MTTSVSLVFLAALGLGVEDEAVVFLRIALGLGEVGEATASLEEGSDVSMDVFLFWKKDVMLPALAVVFLGAGVFFAAGAFFAGVFVVDDVASGSAVASAATFLVAFFAVAFFVVLAVVAEVLRF